MRLVVDASTLVGELLRERGQVLLASTHIDLYVPARMWDEARHGCPGGLGSGYAKVCRRRSQTVSGTPLSG